MSTTYHHRIMCSRLAIAGGLLVARLLCCSDVSAAIPGTALAGTIDLSPGPDAYAPQLMQLNRATHKLYVAGSDAAGFQAYGIKVIDTNTGTVVAGIDLGRYTSTTNTFTPRIATQGLTVDESTVSGGNKLYVLATNVISGEEFVRVIDGATDTPITGQGTDVSLTSSSFPSGQIGISPIVVNPTNHKVYYVDRNGAVAVVDGPNRALLKTVSTNVGQGPQILVVNPAANKVFVFGRSGAALLDSVTDTVAPISLPDFNALVGVFNSANGRTYLLGTNVNADKARIIGLDASGTVVQSNGTDIPINTRAMTLDATGGLIYIAGPTPYNAPGKTTALRVNDLSVVSNYAQGASNLVYDSGGNGRLFLFNDDFSSLSAELRNQVGVFKLSDSSLSKISVAYRPRTLAINSRTNRIYVADEQTPEMVVLDSATRAVLARVPVRPAQTSSQFASETTTRYIAVSERLNRIYLTRAGFLDVFDGETNQWIQSIVLQATFVAVDDTRGHIYVSATPENSPGNPALFVFDLGTNTLITSVTLPEGCNGLSVNQVTGRVYVSGAGNLRKVQIIDGNSYKSIAAVNAGEPYLSAVNRKTNKVFIASAPNSVSVLNGAADSSETSFSNTTQNGSGQDNVANVGIDEVTNTVYVLDDANGNGAFGHITAFDGDNNYAFLGQVDVGRYPVDIVISHATRSLFVSNNQDGTVSVLQNSTPKPPDLLGNIATRARVGTGFDSLIGGFIVSGPQGSTKKVMIRAIGPSLSAAGLTGVLSDTVLELHDSQGNITINDDWAAGGTFQAAGTMGKTTYPSQRDVIVATGIAPTDGRESAIIATLPTGPSTAIVTGKGGATGVGVVEVYDLDQDSPLQLANISTRGRVGTRENVMIGGLIVLGTEPQRVILRAIGPSLAAFNIPDTLQDPVLDLKDSNGTTILSNDNWQEHEADVVATGFQPSDPRESVIVDTLYPSNYTAIVRGKPDANGNETTGVALIEAYNLH